MALTRVNHFVDKYRDKGITPGSIRWQIFNEKANGLAAFGAIVRKGRTVWIDEERYFDWLRSGDEKGSA